MICFSFEVLDPSDASSTISSSSSSGTLGASSGTQVPSPGSGGPSSSVQRDLAISMGVVGGLLAILLLFLLWRFCTRRQRRNGGNVDQITPQYHPVPTIPGNGTYDPYSDNSIPLTSDDAKNYYELGIQKYGLIIILLSLAQNSFFM